MNFKSVAATVLVFASAACAQTPGTIIPADSNAPLSPIRGDQTLVTNALIGFVNAEPVFADDVFRSIDADLRSLAKNSKDIVDFRHAAGELISRRLNNYTTELMIVTASKAALTEDDKRWLEVYLDKERAKLISEHGGSLPLADQQLAASGSSVEREMADKRREAIVEIYRSRQISSKVVVTRDMVIDAYDKDPKRWQVEEQIELNTITLPLSRWLRERADNGQAGPIIAHPTAEQVKAAEDQAMKTGAEIIAKLKAGADFAVLVEDYKSTDEKASVGGRFAALKRGSLKDDNMEKTAFSLPPNTFAKEPLLIRDPDPTLSEVVVLKTGDKTAARTIQFAEVEPTLEKELRDQQLKELNEVHLDKLASRSAVEAVDRMVPAAVQIAVTRYASQ